MSVFGVDFGNLNSTVAITRYGGVDIVTNEVSKRETTTIVSFTDQERFIGEQGLDRYVRNAQNTIFLLKRCIGMHMDDPNLAAEKEFLTCAIQGDEKGKLMFGVNYCGEMKYFYPEQALAMMLQKLREYVNITATTDPKSVADVRDCVVTVPSYYTPEQRRLMYQACDVAGLHCMTLVNETTASAVDYGIFRGSSLKETEEEAQVVGILDIGYGCTDFLVAKFWRGNCKVLSHSHDFQAGTRAVDYELFKEMAKQVKAKYNVDVTENKRAKLRLLQACERLKYFLSANQSAPLHVENIMDIDISFPAVERSLLESLGAPIAERIRDVIGRGIAAAKVDLAKFHTIEMIGGGCRIPLFKRLVEEVLGRAPGFTLNASETIARGAAITAAMMSPKFQVREFRVAEVPTYPISLGYHVENCREPVSIPFLPQVNKVVPLLADGDHYPRLMEVTVPCTGTFRIYAFNDPNNAAVKGAMHGSYLVGEWELGAHTGKVQGELRDTKIRVNIRPDGLVQVDGAWATDSFEVEVKPEEAKEAKQEGEGAPAAAAPATEGKEAEGKKKRKCRLLDVTIAPNVELLGHSSEAVVKFRSAEHEMHNRDCEIIRTREKKNELESYILDYRPRLSEGGALFDYVTATDRQHFLEQCEADETWLYDEGEQATLEEYTARVVALRSIGDAAFNRHKTRDDTDFALKGFNTRMAAAKNLALAKIGQAAHITEEELRTVAATADEAITWGATSVQEMLAQPKTEACKFTTTDLNTRAAKVENDIRIVVNRPTPPPPKPAPAAAKPAEEAKPADAPAEAEPATEATAEPAVPNGVELD